MAEHENHEIKGDPYLINVLKRVRPYTVVSDDRLISLAQIAQSTRDIPGDIVECGTAKGGSAAILGWARLHQAVKDHPNVRLHLYDTFTGLPAPTVTDGPDAPQYTGANRASPADVEAALTSVGFPLDKVTIHPGLFTETLQREDGPSQISVLHVDADWYESVIYVLRTFYDRVSPGGVIILDDFAFWTGCRHAYYEFCYERQLHPKLHRVGEAVWWTK